MARLSPQLELSRCPHCNVDSPSIVQLWTTITHDHASRAERQWGIYKCNRCGGVVTAWAFRMGEEIVEVYPKTSGVDDAVPQRAKEYLAQALNSIHAPSGAVMLAASAVDSMLKVKGYSQGSLYARIDQAVEANLLTPEMAQWAHQVRLDANDERHADEDAVMPDTDGAKKAIDFALALAEFLFVLPSKVTQGLKATGSETPPIVPTVL